MKKVLLYGNCQLAQLGRWFFPPDFEVLKPDEYGIEIDQKWHNYVFFPKFVLKNEGLLKAFNDCDYFLFQHIHNPRFISSKKLYDKCAKPKLCLPNFRFTLNDTELNKEEIKESYRRKAVAENDYGKDFLDLTDWIESKKERWGESYQLTEDTLHHPSGLYYNKLTKEISRRLDLNLEPLNKDERYHR